MVDPSAAGGLLRQARRRAGLSQVELARRAGVTQSVVSAYESASRQPSLPALAKLVAATGLRLEVRVRGDGPARTGAGRLARRVRRHRAAIAAILRKHGMSDPRLFGSVARGEEHSGSDIDLLVDIGPRVGLIALARCEQELEALLGNRVDLIPGRDLKPAVAAQVLDEAVPL